MGVSALRGRDTQPRPPPRPPASQPSSITFVTRSRHLRSRGGLGGRGDRIAEESNSVDPALQSPTQGKPRSLSAPARRGGRASPLGQGGPRGCSVSGNVQEGTLDNKKPLEQPNYVQIWQKSQQENKVLRPVLKKQPRWRKLQQLLAKREGHDRARKGQCMQVEKNVQISEGKRESKGLFYNPCTYAKRAARNRLMPVRRGPQCCVQSCMNQICTC